MKKIIIINSDGTISTASSYKELVDKMTAACDGSCHINSNPYGETRFESHRMDKILEDGDSISIF